MVILIDFVRVLCYYVYMMKFTAVIKNPLGGYERMDVVVATSSTQEAAAQGRSYVENFGVIIGGYDLRPLNEFERLDMSVELWNRGVR